MKTAFVTGATRGIGLAICQKLSSMNFKVYMGCRSLEKAHNALKQIGNPSNVIPIIIDIEYEDSVKNAYQEYLKIREENEYLDIFINNAGAQLDWIPNKVSIPTLELDIELLDRIFRINTLGALLTIKNFLPALKSGSRIVNVASGSGEFWDPAAKLDYQAGYASSKSALIMMTKKMAAGLKDKGIVVNSCCPGWCKTSMGGEFADTTPEDGANSVIATCFLNDNNPPTGQHFRYGKRILLDEYPSYFCEHCKYKQKQLSLLQKIFSLRNEGKHKVIRLLGIKMKVKRK